MPATVTMVGGSRSAKAISRKSTASIRVQHSGSSSYRNADHKLKLMVRDDTISCRYISGVLLGKSVADYQRPFAGAGWHLPLVDTATAPVLLPSPNLAVVMPTYVTP